MNASSPNSLVSPDLVRKPAGHTHSWPGHMAEDGGSTFGPIPGATLTATADELCLRGTRGEFHVPKAAVVKIGRGRLYPWFFSALQIHHTLPKGSRELQFKPIGIRRREILELLRALGYPVA